MWVVVPPLAFIQAAHLLASACCSPSPPPKKKPRQGTLTGWVCSDASSPKAMERDAHPEERTEVWVTGLTEFATSQADDVPGPGTSGSVSSSAAWAAAEAASAAMDNVLTANVRCQPACILHQRVSHSPFLVILAPDTDASPWTAVCISTWPTAGAACLVRCRRRGGSSRY